MGNSYFQKPSIKQSRYADDWTHVEPEVGARLDMGSFMDERHNEDNKKRTDQGLCQLPAYGVDRGCSAA